MKSARGARRGFTLIELCVVVGIMAALTSILLPVLSKARSAQNSVACLANLRQISLGFRLYAGDYRVYPDPGSTGSPWEQSLGAYLDNNEVFHCAADDEVFPSVASSYDWRDTGSAVTTFAARSPNQIRGGSRILCFDALPGWHRGDWINVGLHDGSARSVDTLEYWRDMDAAAWQSP